MLNHIYIRDLATIESLHLDLHAGCSMITGETGAGKSIFIEAIELGLGGRSTSNLVRSGKEKAEVCLCFDISQFPKVIAKLEEHLLYQANNECIIRRVINNDGRSRFFINGSPAIMQLVKEVGELLFHLHGQHEQQVLLKSETQREMLDRFADQIVLAHEVKTLAEKYRKLLNELHELENSLREKKERRDYLLFQLEEFDALNLKEDEWANLENEHKRYIHAETLIKNIQQSICYIATEDERDLNALLHEIKKSLEAIQPIEPKSKSWVSVLDSVSIQMDDLKSELEEYLERTEIDPERLQMLEERMGKIYNLSRKHKITPEELFHFHQKLLLEVKNLDASDEIIKSSKQNISELLSEYKTKSILLSEARKKSSLRFESEITETIRSLSLPHGLFKVDFETLQEDTSDKIFPEQISPNGLEKIIFKIKTNPDQQLQPLNKVISGGELSRLSLAVHLALAHKTTIPTLVFDEVDTGLSGATAEKIGKLLRKLGNAYQVFCVTHQPQVAANGHHHLLVEKYFIEQSTFTRLRILEKDERTREIARMLGGEKITRKTIEHAQEVLQGI